MSRKSILGALVAVVALVAPGGAPRAEAESGGRSAGAAARAFERFRALEGQWQARDSRGNPVQVSYEVVADGSAVLEREVMQHEGHLVTMLTVYHLDGDQFLLTHYCAAGNQPRMRASAIEEQEIRFELHDATGLDSPGEGHMHRAVFRFVDDGTFSSAWTFRKDGQDSFTERATYTRAAPRASAQR